MTVKLYALSLSHPARAARAMLVRKGIEHRVITLLPGFHPLLLRAAGFRGATVPALRANGRRVQGSREIARALEEMRPEPPLFPADGDRRYAVEEAESWGEAELQETVRRIFRWTTANRPALRRFMAEEVGLPAPGLAAAVNAPVAHRFARIVNATDETTRADLESLPQVYDHVDSLIADGTIGGGEPNAADFQIASSIRVLLTFKDLRPALEERPCGELALRLFPEYPGPLPVRLPSSWLPV